MSFERDLSLLSNLHKLTQSDLDDHDVNSNSFVIEEVQSLRCHFEGPYCNSFETEEDLDRHVKLYHRYSFWDFRHHALTNSNFQ